MPEIRLIATGSEIVCLETKDFMPSSLPNQPVHGAFSQGEEKRLCQHGLAELILNDRRNQQLFCQTGRRGYFHEAESLYLWKLLEMVECQTAVYCILYSSDFDMW